MRLWNAIGWVRRMEPFGSRLDEFMDLEKVWDFVPNLIHRYNHSLFADTQSGYPPAEVFGRARSLVNRLPQGYFLWVHVMAPHYPYLPHTDLGRFLPGDEMRNAEEQASASPAPTYAPERQNRVDKVRLRYDEFIADADSALSDFLAHLETDGKLADTAVIVSSDHGDSFQAGVFQHKHPYKCFRRFIFRSSCGCPVKSVGRVLVLRRIRRRSRLQFLKLPVFRAARGCTALRCFRF